MQVQNCKKKKNLRNGIYPGWKFQFLFYLSKIYSAEFVIVSSFVCNKKIPFKQIEKNWGH